jgi:hypothetical protein
MAFSARWNLAVVVLSIGCGPSVELEDGSTGSSGSAAASTGADDAGVEGPMASCRPPADAVSARLVTGRGTPTIEVLTDESGDPEPLGCDDPMPRCNYDVHRLVPLREIVAGSFDVQAGTLSHQVETCGCCNGEGGDSDQWVDTWDFETGHLELDVVDDTCVMGTFLGQGSQWIPFVAERCDE